MAIAQTGINEEKNVRDSSSEAMFGVIPCSFFLVFGELRRGLTMDGCDRRE